MEKIDCKGWLVADLECQMYPESHSNKFYARAKEMLCVITKDVVTREYTIYKPGMEEEMIEALLSAPRLVMHHGRGFDLPALGNIFPEYNKALRAAPLVDTLLASREMYSMEYLSKQDEKKGFTVERSLHSIKAWGRRLGIPMIEEFAGVDWETQPYTEKLGEYCTTDVAITDLLFRHLLQKKRISKLARTNHFWKRTNQMFDSKFEKKLHEGVLSHCDFHTKGETYEYTISHKYHPDFLWTDANGKTYLIESKGNFEDTNEASKYRHIRDHLPENTELVFCFMHPNTSMPRAKVRKDGTKATMGEWATRRDFRWFTEDTIKELFNEE